MEHLLQLIVFTCTAAVASSSAATKTTCFAPPAYLGQWGSLTCYFPVDVTAENFSFNVRRAGRHDFDYKRDTVLDCDWIEGEQLCLIIKDGFTYDYHVSSRLTMIIPNVTLDHQGLYTCQMFKEATSNIQSCSLTVSEQESSPRPSDGVIFGTAQTTLPTTLETPPEEKQVQTADLNMAAIVVPVVIGAVVVVAIVIVVYVVKRRNVKKIREETTLVGDDESGTHYQERQPLTEDSCVTSPASTVWYDREENAADKDRANGEDAREKNVDDNGCEHSDDDGDKRNNDENQHSKPGKSRDDKGMEDEEGAGATKKALKKGPGALKKTLKKKFDLVVKQMKSNNETGVENLREVPDKRKSAWRDQKEKMNTSNLQEPDEKLNMIHELQETHNGSEHLDDNGDERNNDENEHNKPGTSRDDKGNEDEEGAGATKRGLQKGPGALKQTLKKKFDLVVQHMKRNKEKGVDNLREVPDKRKSAWRDPKEKVKTTNLQEPDQTLTQIHELQETYIGCEHRDDDDDERNNDNNEHSMSGIPLDDTGKEDEECSGASKDTSKRMYDLVVKELERNNVKGVNILRKVPDKRKSAFRDPKEKGNTTNLQEPLEKMKVIHEET